MVCRFLEIRKNDIAESFAWLKSRSEPDRRIEQEVLNIIDAVRKDGADALLYYTRKFDCPDFAPPFRVAPSRIRDAADRATPEERSAIERAVANIREFHENQIEKSWFISRDDGSILGQRVLPVEAAGLYVPGGKNGDTPLLSSLLMNAIPALVAGCPRVAVVTPPRPDGSINSSLLAAAGILGLNEIYSVGGPWSIAALALGAGEIKPVDVVAGPGNIYVTTAKRLLHGRVSVDMIAGPSEVLILADDSANPAWLAADLLSQAEHDVYASAILVTPDRKLAESTMAELASRAASLPRREIASRSLADWGCVALVPDMEVAAEVANYLAPEHLQVCARDPWDLLPRMRDAGAIFIGSYSPEAAGDYFAGPNHVLPTMGSARFASPLGVRVFCKRTNVIYTSRKFMETNAGAIARLARLEGLEAHARSAEIRNV